MRIYEGKAKELRPLEGWDGDALFSFHDKYSAPIASWKFEKRTKKKKAKKAGAKKNSIAETPFDLSPCSAFVNAGGGEMLLENDDMAVDGNIEGEVSAI